MSDEKTNPAEPTPVAARIESTLPLKAVDPLYERMAAMALPPEATNPAVLLRDHAAHPWAFEVAKRFATMLEQGAMLPKSYVEDRTASEARAAATVAIMHGAKIGLDPLGAVQGLAVVNGMPKLWGDALPAVVMPHGVRLQEDLPEEWNSEAVAVCTVIRPGEEPVTRRFRYADAERAKLLQKPTWVSYPLRMLQMRARGFAIRDACPDLLAGFGIAEEAMDEQPERFEARVLTRPSSTEVQAAVLRETTKQVEKPDTQEPASAPDDSGELEPEAAPKQEPDSPEPTVDEHSQLGGDIVGRLVEAGMPLDLAKRVTVDERVADTGSVHATKKAKPRKGTPGDVWMCENDCTAHVLVEDGEGDNREWIQLDLSPPKPAQTAAEEAAEFYDQAAAAREAEAAEEPLLDPKELDPDVPGPGHDVDESWKPEVPEVSWEDCYAAEMPDSESEKGWVWISSKRGRTKGVAYAIVDDTWKPSGDAGNWARAMLVANWIDSERKLNELIAKHQKNASWKTCYLDVLYTAVVGTA